MFCEYRSVASLLRMRRLLMLFVMVRIRLTRCLIRLRLP